MTKRHWLIIFFFVLTFQSFDHFIFDPMSKASQEMVEVQEIVEPDTAEVDTIEVYDHLDFFIDKLAKIVRILYDRGLVTWEDSQALQGIDQKWLKYQGAKLSKEIEKEMRKEK